MTTGEMNPTHDVSDPLEDAYARGVTFTPEQAEWIAHHIRNGLVALAIIVEEMGATPQQAHAATSAVNRLMRLVQTAELGVRTLRGGCDVTTSASPRGGASSATLCSRNWTD